MNEILKRIGEFGLVPVVKIDEARDAVPLGRALLEGGLPCAEVTFRTEAAEESIRRLTTEFPEMLVGAGTVLSVGQAERAVAAGAKFIVSPGLNPKVVGFCMERQVPVTPGVASPTEIEAALGFGLDVLKFFPAEVLGGLGMLKAVSAVYGQVMFVPTGGINAANLNDYLSFPRVLACGGSWMVSSELIKAGDFARIAQLTREAVDAVLGFSLAHVGINAGDADGASALARALCAMFGLPLKEGASADYAGSAFEIVKGDGRGTHGHLAIQTNSLARAVAYLARRGVAAERDSVKKAANVTQTAIYLAEEIGGFAIHLLQKK